jgi:hypothetical protein
MPTRKIYIKPNNLPTKWISMKKIDQNKQGYKNVYDRQFYH